jgi:hypothetical protein
VAEPAYAQRCLLNDFVTAELLARVALCPHRLEPVPRTLKNGRQEFLAFAQQFDEDLSWLGAEFQCPAELSRGLLQMLSATTAIACAGRRNESCANNCVVGSAMSVKPSPN